MKTQDDIEKLFKEKLSDHRTEVDPSIWQGVQSGLKAGAGAAGSSGFAGLSGSAVAGISSAVAVIGIAVGAYFLTADDTPAADEIEQREQIAEKKNESNGKIPVVQSDDESPTKEAEVDNSTSDQVKEEKPLRSESEQPAESRAEESAENGSDREEKTAKPKGAADPQPDREAESNAGEGRSEARVNEKHQADNEVPEKYEDKVKRTFESVINVTPASGTAPLDVELSCYIDLKRAKWEFSDGSDPAHELTEVHTFEEPGTYRVTLTGETPGGETFINTVQISVSAPEENKEKELPPALIDVANVITPNGDGVNDQLNFIVENVEEFTLEVYNRGGTRVFTTSSGDRRWDGRDERNQNCPEGTYFYKVTARGIDGNIYQPKGFIELRR